MDDRQMRVTDPSNPYATIWTRLQWMNSQKIEPPMTKEGIMEKFEGGWAAEGKEPPIDARICTMCQWERKNDQMEEPSRDGWCISCCIENEPSSIEAPP